MTSSTPSWPDSKPQSLRQQRILKLKKLKEKLAAEKERKRLEEASKPRRWPSPLDMAVALDALTVRTPALDKINQALVDMTDGRAPKRLAVFMSPQEGKSTLCSFWYPLWLLVHNPDLRIMIVSYADEMARRWGGELKTALEERWNGDEGTVDLGLRLRPDSRAAGRWQVKGRRGGIYCVGIGGSITGKAVDIMVVDDPLSGLEQALSEKYRGRGMRVWRGSLIPRLSTTTPILWIQTLWHELEPIQQILETNRAEWTVVRIPAFADEPDDPLGRALGEPMISARGERDWNRIRRDVGEYVFSAVYQQRPSPAEGGLFKRLWWRYWSPAPRTAAGERLDLAGRIYNLADCWRFASMDLATSTKTSADWTVVTAMALTIDGDLVVLDMMRAHVDESGHFLLVRPLDERWGLDTTFVEKSQYGTTLAKEAGQAGVHLTPIDAELDKFTRALPASARASGGRMWLPAGAPWLPDWLNEFASFPNGSHDDIVDTVSQAVRVAITKAAPKKPPPARKPTGEIDFLNEPM